MSGIGSLIREIDVKIVRNLIKANKLLLSKTSSRILSVKVPCMSRQIGLINMTGQHVD